MSKVKPGLAFSLVCDLGFAVGVATHDLGRMGTLIWIAEPTFEEEPTVDDVVGINQWRWPVFFPLSIYIRRKIVTPIGVVRIPAGLEEFPMMRGRDLRGGWVLVKFVEGVSQSCGVATDPKIPVNHIVNDIRLREMIVSGWKSEQRW